MRAVIAVILCLCALPVSAQDLRGQWSYEDPHTPSYMGSILIDADGRVTFDTSINNGRIKWKGFLDRKDGIKIVLTNGTDVLLFYCAAETNDRLHCYVALPGRPPKSDAVAVFMSRVGPGPKNLMRVPR